MKRTTSSARSSCTAALPFGKYGIEGQCRLSRSGKPCNDNQLIVRDLHLDVLEVVDPGTLDMNEFIFVRCVHLLIKTTGKDNAFRRKNDMSPDRKLFFCRTTFCAVVLRLDKPAISSEIRYRFFPFRLPSDNANSMKRYPIFIPLIIFAGTLPFVFLSPYAPSLRSFIDPYRRTHRANQYRYPAGRLRGVLL